MSIGFPPHLSMTLTHNEHKTFYRTVDEAVAQGDHGYAEGDWVSDEQQQLAIDTNECWTLQWYPVTPVGFNILSAATLAALMTGVPR